MPSCVKESSALRWICVHTHRTHWSKAIQWGLYLFMSVCVCVLLALFALAWKTRAKKFNENQHSRIDWVTMNNEKRNNLNVNQLLNRCTRHLCSCVNKNHSCDRIESHTDARNSHIYTLNDRRHAFNNPFFVVIVIVYIVIVSIWRTLTRRTTFMYHDRT